MSRVEARLVSGRRIDTSFEKRSGDVRTAEETRAGERFGESFSVGCKTALFDPFEYLRGGEEGLEAREVAVQQTGKRIGEPVDFRSLYDSLPSSEGDSAAAFFRSARRSALRSFRSRFNCSLWRLVTDGRALAIRISLSVPVVPRAWSWRAKLDLSGAAPYAAASRLTLVPSPRFVWTCTSPASDCITGGVAGYLRGGRCADPSPARTARCCGAFRIRNG